ncbi:MAG: FkbM family methyltransferase [Prosthecobacter sp.]
MLNALRHALNEGSAAAAQGADLRARLILRHDFFFSRMLKILRWPGYNKLRQISFQGRPLAYRFNRGDLQSLREVLIEEVYQCQLPFKPRTALDLGANIGLTSVWIWRWMLQQSEQSHIIAVEPLAENAEVAEQNFRLSAISGKVVRAAVGQRSAVLPFFACAESNLGRIVPGSEAIGSMAGSRSVTVIGIRELLGSFPDGVVDVLKMDIEGSEGPLLSGDLDWLAGTRALMVEWHDDIVPSGPLIDNVVRAGFRHERINALRQHNLSLFVRVE